MKTIQKQIMDQGFSKREARHIRHTGDQYAKSLYRDTTLFSGKPKAGLAWRIERELRAMIAQRSLP